MSTIQQTHSNEYLPYFIRLLNNLNDRLLKTHKRTYAFQIISQQNLLYKEICTLASFLEFSPEQDLIKIFIILGLFTSRGPQLRCNHDQWTTVANRCNDGVTYRHKYGKYRLNFLVLGIKPASDYSIENQRERGHKAILFNRNWFEGIKKEFITSVHIPTEIASNKRQRHIELADSDDDIIQKKEKKKKEVIYNNWWHAL